MRTGQLLADQRSGRWLDEEVRWDAQHLGAAPQFRCRDCRRWITKGGPLILLNPEAPGPEPVLLCLRCMDHPTPRQAHARWYPDCPEGDRHDMYDRPHPHAFGTQVGIAHVLGMWPLPSASAG